ncbi:MAG: epimerase [Ignavibacteriae bacterium]|nr:MAG: epimerase [Ignavibacteriota bacterium]
MAIKAIIFGASGMVGEGVLIEALKHKNVESVFVIGRRPCNTTHPKLVEAIHQNFFDFSALEERLKGYNACCFCLGVSSLGMNERDYSRITYDLTMAAAKTLSRLNPDMTFCYVSGTGTDSTEQGTIMWARVKGKTENDLSKLPFKAVYLFRPGLMKPNAGQKNIKPLFKIAGLLYQVFHLLSPNNVCTLEDIGLAMIHAVESGFPKKILENRDITPLAHMG